jgi:hypothetical protein
MEKGPISVPQFSHITLRSKGTTAQPKAMVYHRGYEECGSGSVGIFIVPRKTTFTIDSMGFKNNVKRVLFGDINSTIIVRDSSFVNNTYDGEGSCIRVEKGSVIIGSFPLLQQHVHVDRSRHLLRLR